MLQHDYLEEMIHQFVEAVAVPLRRLRKDGDLSAATEIEDSIASLIDLDPAVALSLSPDSLVTMMVLSGVGDSIASYVDYALRQLADAYGRAGDEDHAAIRRAQAQAVAESFNVDEDDVPEGLGPDAEEPAQV